MSIQRYTLKQRRINIDDVASMLIHRCFKLFANWEHEMRALFIRLHTRRVDPNLSLLYMR